MVKAWVVLGKTMIWAKSEKLRSQLLGIVSFISKKNVA